MEDLDTAFESIIGLISSDGNADINTELFPLPSANYVSNELIIQKGTHHYGGLAVEQIIITSTKNALRRLALLLIADLTQNHDRKLFPTITLNSSNCDVTAVQINTKNAKRVHIPLFHSHLILERFKWYYSATDKHPWCRGRDMINRYHYPQIFLSQFTNGVAGFTDPEKRDTVVIDGCTESICNFAEFLLNISDPNNECVEFELEGEAGFRGVSPYSAELRIFLPGSILYDYHHGSDAKSI